MKLGPGWSYPSMMKISLRSKLNPTKNFPTIFLSQNAIIFFPGFWFACWCQSINSCANNYWSVLPSRTARMPPENKLELSNNVRCFLIALPSYNETVNWTFPLSIYKVLYTLYTVHTHTNCWWREEEERAA